VICGLHTCGDLAPTMIRSFVQSEAELLVNVGCCYHFLSEVSSKNCETAGFPMSELLQSLHASLHHRAKNLAAQAMYRWTQQIGQDLNVFIKHHYRAILQVILREKGWIVADGDEDIYSVGHLGKESFNSFIEYAQASLTKFGKNDEITLEELQQYEKRFSEKKKILQCFKILVASNLQIVTKR